MDKYQTIYICINDFTSTTMKLQFVIIVRQCYVCFAFYRSVGMNSVILYVIVLFVKLTFESQLCGLKHQFSTHEGMFLRQKCLDLGQTWTPNPRIHAEFSTIWATVASHLLFNVSEHWLWWYRYFVCIYALNPKPLGSCDRYGAKFRQYIVMNIGLGIPRPSRPFLLRDASIYIKCL